MKRIDDLLKKMLKIDKHITAREFCRILNGNPLKIDLAI